MKPSSIFIIVLLAMLVLLQYKLWLSPDGIPQFTRLKNQISQMNTENATLQARNTQVAAEVENLKNGDEAIEEHARNDLGLVKSNEVFYQVVQ